MITETARSSAPVDALWALVGDPTRWGELLPTFRSVTPLEPTAPLGVGSRFEVRQPGLARAVYEVTDWQPGRSFTWVSRQPGITTTATHTVVPAEGGSTLDLGLLWTGPLAPVARLLLARRGTAMVRSEAQTLARLAAGGRS